MKVFAERIYPTEQYGNIKLHLEDDVHAEESTEQVMLRLVANLKLATVEKLVYSKPVEPVTQTSSSVHTQQPAKPAPQVTIKTTAAQFNPAPLREQVPPAPQAPAIDPKTVCPRCGKNKKPEYDLCYVCHMEATQR